MFTKKQITRMSSLFAVVFILFTACFNSNKSDKVKDKDKDQLQTLGTAKTAIQYVRKNASLPGTKADLEAMEAALAKMKQMPCNSVISWYYQGAIHWTPNTVLNGNPLCPSYTQKSQKKVAWQNCTHTPESKLHFLIWHRLYLWYFEKIVRKLSGKNDFAMPYWDYVDPKYRVMPSNFRDPKDSLYQSGRLKNLNAGEPINDAFAMEWLVEAMRSNDTCKQYELFNSNINGAPHGMMHDYIGAAADVPGQDTTMWNIIYQDNTGGLMANVSSAGFDPIFWVHHSNIDYLWTKWDASANGARPILAELEKKPWQYVFFDENGNKVSYTVAQAFEKAFNMDYRYDTAPVLIKAKTPVPENRQEILSMDLNEPVRLFQHKVNIKVENKVQEMLLKKDLTRKSYILEVTVSYQTAPRHSYKVYIDTDKPDPKKFAGIMNFFGAKEMMTMDMDMHGGGNTETFLYDITDEFDIKTMKDNLRLLIVNSSGKPATEITVTKVRIETRDF
jgi:Common central domain of tyrosinase